MENTPEDELPTFADSDDSDYDEFDPYNNKKPRKQVERELVPGWCNKVKSVKKELKQFLYTMSTIPVIDMDFRIKKIKSSSMTYNCVCPLSKTMGKIHNIFF